MVIPKDGDIPQELVYHEGRITAACIDFNGDIHVFVLHVRASGMTVNVKSYWRLWRSGIKSSEQSLCTAVRGKAL